MIGEIKECLDFVFVEQVAVRLKFLSDAVDVVSWDFNELEGFSGDHITSNILFKKLNDLECFLVGLN